MVKIVIMLRQERERERDNASLIFSSHDQTDIQSNIITD